MITSALYIYDPLKLREYIYTFFELNRIVVEVNKISFRRKATGKSISKYISVVLPFLSQFIILLYFFLH